MTHSRRTFDFGFAHMVALSALSLIPACGSESGDSDSAQSLLKTCTGHYTCHFPDKTQEVVSLEPVGGDCMVDGVIAITDSGIAYDVENKYAFTWSGDSSKFRICAEKNCMTCYAQPSKSGARCTGSPSHCSSLGAGSCVADGCSFNSHVRWDGSIEYLCEGTANSCDEYSSKYMCERQGCTWE